MSPRPFPTDDPCVSTLVIVASLVARVRRGAISAEEAVHELFDLGFGSAPLNAFMNLFAFDDSVMETIFMSYNEWGVSEQDLVSVQRLLDNNSCSVPPSKETRGMLLNIDRPHRTATLHDEDCPYVPNPYGTERKPRGEMGDDGGWFVIQTTDEAKIRAQEMFPQGTFIPCSRCQEK